MSFFVYSIFIAFVTTFILLSLSVKSNLRVYVIILNFVFMGSAYLSIASLVGLPKPIGQYIMFGMSAPEGKVQGAYITKETIYLMIKEEDQIRLYSFKNTPQMMDELEKAHARNGGYGYTIANTTGLQNYFGDTSAHIPLGQWVENQSVPKIETQDNVDVKPIK